MKFTKLLFVLLAAFLFVQCNNKVKQNAGNEATEAVSKTRTNLMANGKIGWAASSSRYDALGEFKTWKFTKFDMKKDDLETLDAAIEVDLTSIWEKSDKLVNHLKAPDFFDMTNYTKARVNISNVKKIAKGGYTVDMTLMMRGIKEEVKGQFKVTGTKPYHIVGTTKVGRLHFGLGADNKGISELVEVTFDTDLPL